MKRKAFIYTLRAQPQGCHVKTLLLLFSLALFLPACTSTQPAEPLPTPASQIMDTTTPEPTLANTHTPSPPAAPTFASSLTPQGLDLPAPAPEAGPPLIQVQAGSGPNYELVFSVPVGEGSVQYRGQSAPEGLVEGPNALGVFADGSFGLADPASGSLVRLSPAGELLNLVELRAVGIHMLSGFATSINDFLVLEAGFGPEPQVYRIYRVTQDGEVTATYDLPDWARLESGLTGISAWQTGEVYLELGGNRAYLFVTKEGELAAQPVVAPLEPGMIRWQPPDGEQAYRLETRLTFALGGLRLLSANLDGSFFVIREDLIDQEIISVDQTVHFMNELGEQVGVARMPQDESLYYAPGALASGPDGQVYGLVPRQDSLDIVRLIFYEQLDALRPEAAIPHVRGYSEGQ
jgi:hypothetical protein